MTIAQYAPRHRKVRRPVVPVDAANRDSSFSRGAAVASVTGLALTAVIAPSVNAAPAHEVARAEAATLNTTITVKPQENTVVVSDVAWAAHDEMGVSAENAPTVVETPVEEPEVEEAANRSDIREEAPVYEARVAQVNAAGGDIVSIASNLLGIPYVYGGNTPAGFDCSGFTQYVYSMAGISIPRTSYEQGMAGTFVSAAEARPGDLVWEYGHVGIYAGDGMVIEATLPGDVTKIRPVTGSVQYVRY